MKWTKIMVHRKTNFLLTYPVLVGLSYNFKEGIFSWDGEGYTDFIMSTREIWEESRALSEKIKTDPHFNDEYRRYAFSVCDGAVNIAREGSQLDVIDADDHKLQELASELFGILEKVGTTIVQTRFDAYEQVKAFARGRALSPGELRALIAPPDLSLLAKSQMRFLKILCDYQRGAITSEEFDRALEEHAEQYHWVTTDVGFGIPLSKDDLKQQAAEKLNGGHVFAEYEALSEYTEKVAEAKHALLEQIRPPEDIIRLMTALADESFFRQYRRDTYSQAEYYARSLFEEIGRRSDLTLPEVYYLMPDEIGQFLLNRTPVNRTELESRMKVGVIFRIEGGHIRIISGKEVADHLASELEGEKEDDDTSRQFVEGETAYPGRAHGTARVVLSEADIKNVQSGDIFISTQATPNLINRIIDKVAAIVTDEGDITSHAALVAWENQIPCVVGTQKATKIFQSGDAVEVDAEKSIAERSIVRRI